MALLVLLKLWSSKTTTVCWYFKGSLRRIGGIGDSKGKPLKVASVYDMLNRMKKKTGIKNTPHMLRHYFANMRKEAGWLHFSKTSKETMSDKIKRMLKNEIQQM